MFIVASDLSEAQRERERLTGFLSLRGMDIPAYTFEAVRTVFVELFCTPTSSTENPSLRVSGRVSSMNKTFIVEDYAQDEFGQWTKDEVTGKQGYVMMKGHVSGRGTTLSVPGSPENSRAVR